jgi:hypothetical protein
MSAVVYCGSMGDWPLLTDAQRMEGVERLVKAGSGHRRHGRREFRQRRWPMPPMPRRSVRRV